MTFQSLEDLFYGAVELDAEGRDALITELRDEDPKLCRALERLLAFDAPFSEDGDGRTSDDPWIGATIGQYAVQSLLGRGGMGSVYAAEQSRPQRTVALKLLTAGFHGEATRQRFRFESEVLGQLQHPGIARVLESGFHTYGGVELPYFAMELVPGARPLVDHANDHDLDLRQRVELMAKVCDAVHHGHQNGVIHRDLKPANLLVGDDGEPRVIDFGVARTTDLDLAVSRAATLTGQLLGTPHYMSPEQLGGEPIDVRTDVYSIGVVLYELLTRTVPFAPESSTFIEWVHAVREGALRRPSSLESSIPRDLDAILMKSLATDREQRYPSAEALERDLRRWLDGTPVEARTPSAGYLLAILYRRHRLAVWAGTSTILLLTVATVVLIGLIWERDQMLQRVMKANLAGTLNRTTTVATRARLLDDIPESLRGWEVRHAMHQNDTSIAVESFQPGRGVRAAWDSVNGCVVEVDSTSGSWRAFDISDGSWTAIGEGTIPNCSQVAVGGGSGALMVCMLARRGEVNTLFVFDRGALEEGKPRWSIEVRDSRRISVHPRAPRLVALSEQRIQVWDFSHETEAPKLVCNSPVTTALRTEIVWLPRADSFLVGSYSSGKIYLVTPPEDKTFDESQPIACREVGQVATEHLVTLSLNGDGTRLVAGGSHGHVSVVNTERVESGQCPVVLSTIVPNGIIAARFARAGPYLYVSTNSPTIHCYRLDEPASKLPSLRPLAPLRGHSQAVTCLISTADELLTSWSVDGTRRTWVPMRDEQWKLRGHRTSVTGTWFMTDSHLLTHCAEVGRGETLILRDRRTLRCLDDISLAHRAGVRSAVVVPGCDSRRLLIAFQSGEEGIGVALVEVSGDKLRWLGSRIIQEVTSGRRQDCRLSISEIGGRFVLVTDEALYFGEVADGDFMKPESVASDAGRARAVLSLDPTGRWIAVGAGPLDDPQLTFRRRPAGVAAPGDRGESKSVGVGAESIALDKNRRLFAAGDGLGTIRLGRLTWSDEEPSLRVDHVIDVSGPVTSLRFHPIEPRLYAGLESSLAVVDTSSGELIVEMTGQRGSLTSLHFDATGDTLVTSANGSFGSGNVAMLWETSPTSNTDQWDRTRARELLAEEWVKQLFRDGHDLDSAKQTILNETVRSEPIRNAALIAIRRHGGSWDTLQGQVERSIHSQTIEAERAERLLQWLRTYEAENPWKRDAVSYRAILLDRLDRTEDARAALNQAILNASGNGTHWSAERSLAYLDLRSGQASAETCKRHLDRAEEAVRLGRQPEAAWRLVLGMARYHLGSIRKDPELILAATAPLKMVIDECADPAAIAYACLVAIEEENRLARESLATQLPRLESNPAWLANPGNRELIDRVRTKIAKALDRND